MVGYRHGWRALHHQALQVGDANMASTSTINWIFAPPYPHECSESLQRLIGAVELCHAMLNPPPIARAGVDATGGFFITLRSDNSTHYIDLENYSNGIVNYIGAMELGRKMGQGAPTKNATEALAQLLALSIVFRNAAHAALNKTGITQGNKIATTYPALQYLSDAGKLGIVAVIEDGEYKLIVPFNLIISDGVYVAQLLETKKRTARPKFSFTHNISSPRLTSELTQFIHYCLLEHTRRAQNTPQPFIYDARLMAFHNAVLQTYVNAFLAQIGVPAARLDDTCLHSTFNRRVSVFDLSCAFSFPVKLGNTTIYNVSPFTEGFSVHGVLHDAGVKTDNVLLVHYNRCNLGALVLLIIAAAILRDLHTVYSQGSAGATLRTTAFSTEWSSMNAEVSFYYTGEHKGEKFGLRGVLRTNKDDASTFTLALINEPYTLSSAQQLELIFNFTDAFMISYLEPQTVPPAWAKALQLVGALYR